MQPALNCRSLRADLALEELLNAASSAGFSGVEVRMIDVRAYAEQNSWDSAKDLFAIKNIKPISFIDGLYPGLLAPKDKYDEALRGWADLCKAASLIDCKLALIIINPRTDESPIVAAKQAVARLQELAQVAMDFGVILAVEALGIKEGISPRLDGQNYFMDRFSQSVELACSTGLSNIGVILDAFHWYVAGGSLDEIEGIPKDKLALVQINDAPLGEPSKLRDSQRVLPGEGVIDLVRLLSVSRETGFDGYVSLEIFNEELWAMEPDQAALKSFKSIRQVLNKI